MDLAEKDYVVVVQCHLVKQRCSGYGCESSFHHRTGGFAAYPAEKHYRHLKFTCGGCCGMATQRKLAGLLRKLKKEEDVAPEQVVVQLASCITRDNYHSPVCPHVDYIKTLISRLKVDCRDDTVISQLAEKRRREGGGVWAGRPPTRNARG
jgi:predicted metal-binding protein